MSESEAVSSQPLFEGNVSKIEISIRGCYRFSSLKQLLIIFVLMSLAYFPSTRGGSCPGGALLGSIVHSPNVDFRDEWGPQFPTSEQHPESPKIRSGGLCPGGLLILRRGPSDT